MVKKYNSADLELYLFDCRFPQSQSWIKSGSLETEGLVEYYLKELKLLRLSLSGFAIYQSYIFDLSLVLEFVNITKSVSAIEGSVSVVDLNPLISFFVSDKNEQRRCSQDFADAHSKRFKILLLDKVLKCSVGNLGSLLIVRSVGEPCCKIASTRGH